MANIGDQLLNPEQGWKRYDDSDGMISYTGSWTIGNNLPTDKWLNGTASTSKGSNREESLCKFRFYGTSLRLIGVLHPNDTSKSATVSIDGVAETFVQFSNTQVYKVLNFEKVGLEEKIHEVEIYPNVAGSMYIDAIDINDTGILVPELSRDYEFPVKIGNEEDVADYAESLIGGEEQLLITREGKLFLTNGNKGFITVGGEVDLSAYYNKEEIDKLIADNLHEHANKDIIDSLGDSANMLTYKGKVVVNNNEYSFRSLPRAKVVENYSTSKGGKLPWLS